MMLSPSQLSQPYATALACPITNASNPGTTLLTTAQPTSSLSALTSHHHAHATANTTSPYIILSTSATQSDEVCSAGVNAADLTAGLINGKATNLSSPSTFYFYNHNSTPTMYPTDFLRL